MGDDSPDNGGYDAELRDVAKGGGLGMVGKFGQQLIALVVGPVTARLLGAGGYGLLDLSSHVSEVLRLVLALGLPSAILRYVGIYEGEDRREMTRGAVTGTLLISASLGLIASTIIMLRPEWITEGIYHKPEMTLVLRIMILALPLGLCTSMLAPTTIARRTMVYRMITDLISRPVTLAGILVACWLLDYGPEGAAAAMVINSAVIMSVFATGVRRLVGKLSWRDLRNFEWRRLQLFALPLLLSQMANFGLFRINSLIGGAWLTNEELGQYAAASRLATFGLFGVIAIGSMFTPIIADLHNRGKRMELRDMFQTTTRWGYILTLPAILIAIVKAPGLLMLFGPGFPDATDALRVLCVGQLLNASAGPASLLLAMSGYPWVTAANNTVMALVNVLLCISLTKSMRLQGLALAATIATGGVSVARAIEATFILRITPYTWRAVKPLAAAALASPLLLLRFDAWIVDLALPSALFGLVYLLALKLIGLEKDDQFILAQLRTKLRRGSG